MLRVYLSLVPFLAVAGIDFTSSSAKAQFVGVETFEGLNVGDNPAILPNFSNPFGDLAVVESDELGRKVVVGTGEGSGLDLFNRMQINMVSPEAQSLHKITADLFLFADEGGQGNQHIQVFEDPIVGSDPTIFLARYDGTGTWRFDVRDLDDSLIHRTEAAPTPGGAEDHLAQVEFLLNTSTGDLTFSVDGTTLAEANLPPSVFPHYRQLALTADHRAGRIGMQIDSVAVELIEIPGIDGDFNGDGVVDAADYTVWRDGLGEAFDEGDYQVWKTNFGATAPSATVGANVAVPEPGGLTLLFGLGAAFLLRHRALAPQK